MPRLYMFLNYCSFERKPSILVVLIHDYSYKSVKQNQVTNIFICKLGSITCIQCNWKCSSCYCHKL